MKAKIGNESVEYDVSFARVTIEDEAALWISGVVTLKMPTGKIEMPIGCWMDTDNDHAEWCAEQEGGRFILTALTGNVEPAGINSAMTFFPDLSEEIGAALCEQLRGEYRDSIED